MLNGHSNPELNRSALFQNLAVCACAVFGLLLIPQVQVAGDGAWFWYAKLFLSGHHLYSDLHFALQPLFVLVTAANMRIFGDGWLVSKLPAALMMIAYLAGLRLVSARAPVSDGVKAAMLTIAFAFPLFFVAYRYDDYHVMADCFEVFSILLLLHLPSVQDRAREAWLAAGLGVLSALSITARLNDGGLLFLTVLLCLLIMAPLRRWAAVLVFVLATGLSFLVILACTGDSLTAYAQNSIFRAAGAKGGFRTLLHYPCEMFPMTLQRVREDPTFRVYLTFMVVVMALVALITWVKLRWVSPGARAAIITAAIFARLSIGHHWKPAFIPTALSGAMVLVAYLIGAFVLGQAAYEQLHFSPRSWNRNRLLLLIPLGQLLSGSLSSGGHFDSLCAPIGILLLLLPFSFPTLFSSRPFSYGYASVLALTALSCFAFKIANPFSWHTYTTPAMFKERQWYRHPQYGPMVIDTELLHMVQPICDQVNGTSNTSLLTMPFPFPNYFCAIPPWHNAVQTFFDTSTAETVHKLESDLDKTPPQYIAYQRQIHYLRVHELVFNHGNALPQRSVDELLYKKLASGQWSTVRQQCLGQADWILIKTVPSETLLPGERAVLDWNPQRCSNLPVVMGAPD